MKSFREYLREEVSEQNKDRSVDFHLAGHFGSGKSTAIEKAKLGNRVHLIDLDDIFFKMVKKNGEKPTSKEGIQNWDNEFKDNYFKMVDEGKQNKKPIVVVGHHWEGTRQLAPVNAKRRVYIDIPKEKVFKQRKERDFEDKKLTDSYLEKEYKLVQSDLDREDYTKLPFSELVDQLKGLK